VDSEHEGWRLDRYVVALIPTLSRARVQSRIRSGHILLQGSTVKPGEKIHWGQEVLVLEPPKEVTLVPESREIHILYEDKDLLVINKEPGITVHPGAGISRGTLAGALLAYCSLSEIGGAERPGIVHRLDKETSGCLVVAKNDAAHHGLSQQFALRKVKKIYLALVQGIPAKTFGIIDAPIRRHPVHRQKMSIARPFEGREAVTPYRVVASASGMSWVECRPQTGRTHQIRLHLKYLGHPILGDPVYGKRGNFPRHLLHAWKLGFEHPASGSSMEFCAPLPADMQIIPFPARTDN
jgi:23S rRNA pseudouridine1911/1915/1917 synthase